MGYGDAMIVTRPNITSLRACISRWDCEDWGAETGHQVLDYILQLEQELQPKLQPNKYVRMHADDWEAIRAFLDKVEWGHWGMGICPGCGAIQVLYDGSDEHRPDCEWKRIRALLGE